MLLRIALIIAILAGLGAGGIGYYEWSTQIPALQKQRDDEHTAKVNETQAHNKTKGELKKTQGELAQTKQELTDTKADRDKAVARADAQEKRASDLNDKLTKVTSERDEAKNEAVAYEASGLKPDEVVKLNKNYKDSLMQIETMKGEYTALYRSYVSLDAKYRSLVEPEHFVKLPADLRGQVVVVDPKWDFVVVNIGGDQGAIESGEMLVSRAGKLVAKVVIRRVEKDRSVANIVPGWKLTEVFEGDIVTPAHPASS